MVSNLKSLKGSPADSGIEAHGVCMAQRLGLLEGFRGLGSRNKSFSQGHLTSKCYPCMSAHSNWLWPSH